MRRILLFIVFFIPVVSSNSQDLDTVQTGVDTVKNRPYYVAGGVGNSYGGVGIRLQVRLKEAEGFAFHLGIGDDTFRLGVGFSAGVKYFPWKSGWYTNLQYGMVDFEKYKYYKDYTKYRKTYGPMLLLGGDFAWGKREMQFGFNTALGVAYRLTNRSVGSPVLSIAGDLGFIVRFK